MKTPISAHDISIWMIWNIYHSSDMIFPLNKRYLQDVYRLWCLKSEGNPLTKYLVEDIMSHHIHELHQIFFVLYSLLCNWLINIIQSNSLCSLANAFWWVQRHGKQQMSEWKSKCEWVNVCVCVSVCNCMYQETNYISNLHFKWDTMQHCPFRIWLLQKWKETMLICMHAITCIYKHIHKHVICLQSLICSFRRAPCRVT